MRDLLYRAKVINRTEDGVYGSHYKNGDWVYGLVSDIDTKYGIIKMTDIFGVRHIEVDPETVGQFAGLYDSTKWEELTKTEQQDWLKCHTKDDWKGKPIFEGDAVWAYGGEYYSGTYETSETVVVKDITDGICVYLGAAENLEVIGNVYDNPELLEETK